jgi:NADH:ubiquinone oxidoreductase subunit 6 (subunit J)
VTALAGAVMLYATMRTPWHLAPAINVSATTYGVGDAFLGAYVLPFEVASLVLLAALVGAVVISRQDPVTREGSMAPAAGKSAGTFVDKAGS